ncbi:uncharacterized protein AMSG_10019 [Thecamonas trahens ATCC 50062]|uniref:Uncharacterized protein n=1 Tax=Thecamonas trahens ATCC 50062 TaxID=461836 RepID=A0A0L0DPK5_THETB|nr:hypothetical protein AMSG_10019 [Thecamonas trahens ATCC 50062]KNC54227.1 hypothetical protein AMSG_10019 [Thecamonas trahens ATCC 50062]|eukprot:XP_013753865.1 hypothetical protein AMSG_10019 [Thecamonas trahens ATCC 50062]
MLAGGVLALPDLVASTGLVPAVASAIALAASLLARLHLSLLPWIVAAVLLPLLWLVWVAASAPALVDVMLVATAQLPPQPTPSDARSLAFIATPSGGAALAALVAAALVAAKADALRAAVITSLGSMLLLLAMCARLVWLSSLPRVASSTAPYSSLAAAAVGCGGAVVGVATVLTGAISLPLAPLAELAGQATVATAALLAMTLGWSVMLAAYGAMPASLVYAAAHATLLVSGVWLGGGWSTGSGLISEAHAVRSLVLASVVLAATLGLVWRRLDAWLTWRQPEPVQRL